MKRTAMVFLFGGLALTGAVGCGDDGGDPVETARQLQEEDRTFFDGEATLTRTDDSFTIDATWTDLTEGDSYTMWWAVFNNPEDCLNIDAPNAETGAFCNGNDFAPDQASVGASFGYCSGVGVADDTGEITASCTRTIADGSDDAVVGGGLAVPPTDGAPEIHSFIRNHGPALTGELGDAQQSEFNGGCNEGDPNEGGCFDEFSFAFPSPGNTEIN